MTAHCPAVYPLSAIKDIPARAPLGDRRGGRTAPFRCGWQRLPGRTHRQRPGRLRSTVGTHPIAAADWPPMCARFAGSRWPDLRVSGLAYVDIATRLLTTHAYGGETSWFYQRLAAACAKHGRALPF